MLKRVMLLDDLLFSFWGFFLQETQLAKVIEKNTELTIANSDLQKKVVELHGVTEECQTLKSTLVSFLPNKTGIDQFQKLCREARFCLKVKTKLL
jgi:hypothetical protein